MMWSDEASLHLLDRLDLAVDTGRPPVVRAPGGYGRGWAAPHRDALHAVVAEHGAGVVRGLRLGDPADVATAFRSLAGDLMADREPFAARATYADGVYSSSTWPPNQPMCMHHELSYALQFPRLMLFACLGAPRTGGETALADSRAVLRALPVELVERFAREGWLLTRSYHEDLGVSWSESFGVDDRGAVERYCRDNAIAFEWLADGTLRTRQRRSALVTHPVTGERCWFNQVAFLNEWTMAAEVREYLVDVCGRDGLPFNTAFGDGDPIGEDVVHLINNAYEANTVSEPWQVGDLMLVDNIRTAHSREPYEGPREVLVAMGEPVQLRDCAPTVSPDPA